MAFELSLQDGVSQWYRQLPRKSRRTWKLLSEAFIKYYCFKFIQSAKTRYYSAKREDKEHVCDYFNRLNDYARNARVQFENGGRESKDHMEHFLDTGDNRGLEERLCHMPAKGIHGLENMINDILKRRDRKTKMQFENGGRQSKDHVEHFLDTCDDRGLEECLCHVRVKDIHDLDDMITSILKRRHRKPKRETSARRPTVTTMVGDAMVDGTMT
ncbi:hypothetical protein PHMEG_00029445 [Phytophthora megakarya]|uniref:Retrotransposon gag domain-containing protein n=1 Tax=Phytophthora megakarya TaxID=4795 RepID=A0A225V3L5_9STRA|nr:hypothetical protein PHMEG_00029445 [Phytophthora megakarya]